MNFKIAVKKASVILFFSFYCSLSICSVEANRSVRIVKRKISSSPIQIHLTSGGPGNYYAKKYGYERPSFNFHGKYEKDKRYFERRNKKFGPRNYANAYRNWTPNRYPPGKKNLRFDNGKYYPRIDNGRRGPQKHRKEPYPFIRDPSYKNNKQKRKVRPQRPSPLQRPKPPKYVSEFDEDYYFPEEALKAESQHDFEALHTRSKKKRRNPGNVEKVLNRPESKNQYTGGKTGKQYSKKVRDGYGTYVRHPYRDEEDEDYDDEKEAAEYVETVTKSKKKRTKKKSSTRKKPKDEEDYPPYPPDQEELGDNYRETYVNEYESKKRNKKQSYSTKDEEVHSYPSSVTTSYNSYGVTAKPQDTTPYVPSYSQPWSNVIGTTSRPVQFSNVQPQQFSPGAYNFHNPQNQYTQQSHQNPISYQSQPNQFNYQNRDYQKPQIITANSQQTNYYSQPDTYNNNNNFVSSPISPTPQVSTNYNTYSNSGYSYQSPTNTYSDNSILKRSPTYESTQNYYSYNGHTNANSNGYVKNQSLSYLDNSQRYENRVSASYQNTDLIKADQESDFLRKHQNLYNKGFSGVPVQGDGYRKDNLKKDYDIGYGDFQFDDSLST
ncbi:hypothetical protein RUM44_009595 [Polyplax serrata]|uniref:Uncharacterized protein n=1 Tax=Polyplax serrata TaxID=468196 RepID=A0ABR1AT52_POLSC